MPRSPPVANKAPFMQAIFLNTGGPESQQSTLETQV